MWNVSLALLPATVFGVFHFGWYAALVVLISIVSAVLSEFAYQKLTRQRVLIDDGSAFLTGLLLGLNMPPAVPLWMPVLGSVFAVLFVKQFFGGLGRNFMNPALAGRCFLLISFAGTMSQFTVDGVASATPLNAMRNGEAVNIADMFFGFTGGTIGEVSALALILGGLYLLARKIIRWEIPVCYIASFALFQFFFGAKSFDPMFVLAHLCGGGLMLGAWFMATDYVTSPITNKGKVIYGILLGILTGVFRTFGATPEGVSYAIIFGNLVVPLIEKITMPKAFGLEKEKKQKTAKLEKTEQAEETAPANKEEPKTVISLKSYRAALNLTVIAMLIGLLLGVSYELTKKPIEDAKKAEEQAAFAAVCPGASVFEQKEAIALKAEEQADVLTERFGKVLIEGVYTAKNTEGETMGYVVNVTTKEGYGGAITISVGTDADGTILGLAFLTLNETAGLGMNAANESFYQQYVGRDVDEFTVVKTGSTSPEQIDAISGATITSKAVTKAVNAAVFVIKQMAE